MKIVILDGFTANPGDLSWKGLEELGMLTVYDRTRPEEVVERASEADAVLTNKVVLGRQELCQRPERQRQGDRRQRQRALGRRYQRQRGDHALQGRGRHRHRL